MTTPNADQPVYVIFDGPPGPDAGQFIEVETADGKSVKAAEWTQDGEYWKLGPLYSTPPDSLAKLLAVMECDDVDEAIAEWKMQTQCSLEAAEAIKTGAAWDKNHWPSPMDRAFFVALKDRAEKAEQREALSVAQALEEAAKVCDEYAERTRRFTAGELLTNNFPSVIMQMTSKGTAAKTLATEIRALHADIAAKMKAEREDAAEYLAALIDIRYNTMGGYAFDVASRAIDAARSEGK